ncbi:MAG: hypothetical protein COW18_02375 [Zetaproteobacteria bacterium CG12_big_fil_rev_8_21_14_0_65_54_13]|nr:MAG: hypothetical protein COX55_10275 [Zetaproteobacteria bacterium CG23_combo_of_CG06-09_8_20_14_all_54_7]PIW51142.1 MAG: hypothetical protein COW18_02375 [Zetaproteobacteria bacterium CG12_big_fil_rev_8_21_14_0_65_54_13]PIX55720.1 MAG: hypothetical protein COZ50_01285 [Zetaproteobacteria bacterium CG_4_10_14_3_um_filter_54_28]PJA29400.1 MAG: hypothetical protein CO188_06655 [Zetaproteobacteria bacterium CG_4_9_14_3_um_filter_54_145]
MITCPFKCGQYYSQYELLICRPHGKLTSDLMNDISICRECIQQSGMLQVNRFHDLRGITSIELGFREVAQLCESEALMRQDQATAIHACYLVPNALLFGTIRMYQMLIEGSGVVVHVSYALDDMAEVLGVEPSLLAASSVPVVPISRICER